MAGTPRRTVLDNQTELHRVNRGLARPTRLGGSRQSLLSGLALRRASVKALLKKASFTSDRSDGEGYEASSGQTDGQMDFEEANVMPTPPSPPHGAHGVFTQSPQDLQLPHTTLAALDKPKEDSPHPFLAGSSQYAADDMGRLMAARWSAGRRPAIRAPPREAFPAAHTGSPHQYSITCPLHGAAGPTPGLVDCTCGDSPVFDSPGFISPASDTTQPSGTPSSPERSSTHGGSQKKVSWVRGLSAASRGVPRRLGSPRPSLQTRVNRGRPAPLSPTDSMFLHDDPAPLPWSPIQKAGGFQGQAYESSAEAFLAGDDSSEPAAPTVDQALLTLTLVGRLQPERLAAMASVMGYHYSPPGPTGILVLRRRQAPAKILLPASGTSLVCGGARAWEARTVLQQLVGAVNAAGLEGVLPPLGAPETASVLGRTSMQCSLDLDVMVSTQAQAVAAAGPDDACRFMGAAPDLSKSHSANLWLVKPRPTGEVDTVASALVNRDGQVTLLCTTNGREASDTDLQWAWRILLPMLGTCRSHVLTPHPKISRPPSFRIPKNTRKRYCEDSEEEFEASFDVDRPWQGPNDILSHMLEVQERYLAAARNGSGVVQGGTGAPAHQNMHAAVKRRPSGAIKKKKVNSGVAQSVAMADLDKQFRTMGLRVGAAADPRGQFQSVRPMAPVSMALSGV